MPSTVSARNGTAPTTTGAATSTTKKHRSLLWRARSKATYVFEHKLLLGVEPVWRYVANASPTREYRRNVGNSTSHLSPESTRMLRDLNRDGCTSSTLEALTGEATLLGRLQELVRGYEAARAEEVAAQAAALLSVDDLGDGNESYSSCSTSTPAGR